MIKYSLSFLALFTFFTGASVQASPVCYMEMHGQLIDLSYMCGDDLSSAPLITVEIDSPAPSTESLEILAAEDPVTFQVTRAKYNANERTTTITGLVVFPQTAEYGAIAWPKVYDQRDGLRIADMPMVERVYGQRRLNVSTDVSGRFYLRDLEGRI